MGSFRDIWLGWFVDACSEAAKVLTPQYTSLRCNLTQADLDFLIFGHQNKTDPTLCNLPIKNLKPPFDTRILHSKKQLPALAVKPQSISSKIHQQLGGCLH